MQAAASSHRLPAHALPRPSICWHRILHRSTLALSVFKSSSFSLHVIRSAPRSVVHHRVLPPLTDLSSSLELGVYPIDSLLYCSCSILVPIRSSLFFSLLALAFITYSPGFICPSNNPSLFLPAPLSLSSLSALIPRPYYHPLLPSASASTHWRLSSARLCPYGCL
ncbi:hypothetical protein BJX64DRAFT_196191 [Aspergillus heterothallicus]